MPNTHSHDGWTRAGFAAKVSASLTATYQAFELKSESTIKASSGVPAHDALLVQLSIELSAMANAVPPLSPSKVFFYVSRDEAGTQPLTPVFDVDILKTRGSASATTGGVVQKLGYMWNRLTRTDSDDDNSLWLQAKVDALTATGLIRMPWRAA